MSLDENKAIARRWNEEVWNKGNLAAIDEFFATDFVFNYPPPGAAPDREGYKQFITRNFATWADIHCTIEDMVAEGDKVAYRVTGRGTHRGEFMGIASTGNKIVITFADFVKITAGKWVEFWCTYDNLRLRQQLGVIPPMEQ